MKGKLLGYLDLLHLFLQVPPQPRRAAPITPPPPEKQRNSLRAGWTLRKQKCNFSLSQLMLSCTNTLFLEVSFSFTPLSVTGSLSLSLTLSFSPSLPPSSRA